MGLKTDNEPGQRGLIGELDGNSIKEIKEKLSNLDFIKHVEPIILHNSRNEHGVI